MSLLWKYVTPIHQSGHILKRENNPTETFHDKSLIIQNITYWKAFFFAVYLVSIIDTIDRKKKKIAKYNWPKYCPHDRAVYQFKILTYNISVNFDHPSMKKMHEVKRYHKICHLI